MRRRGFTNQEGTLPRRLFLLVIVLVLVAGYGEALAGTGWIVGSDYSGSRWVVGRILQTGGLLTCRMS